VSFDRPVRIARLVVPHTSLRQNVFGHRAFADLCRRIGARLLPEPPPVEMRPAYLSKTGLPGGLRRIVNEAGIEALLAAEGVEIVHPERLSFAQQLALFAGRRTVLGTAGSAFHTALFVQPAGRAVVLSPRPSINSNYVLFDRLGGADTGYWFAEGTELVEDDRFLRGFHVPDPQAVGRALVEQL
jgi:capsular polysaccharide biosynthesis protein